MFDNSKTRFVCKCKMCNVSFKNIDTGKDSDYGPYDNNIKRAGTFIHTENPIKKILLVQSYNGKWGPPKGKIELNETSLDCAIRETREETGLNVLNIITNCKTFNNKWDIYNIKLPTTTIIDPQSDEITGYGWFSYECVIRNRNLLNHPAKLAIREFTTIKI